MRIRCKKIKIRLKSENSHEIRAPSLTILVITSREPFFTAKKSLLKLQKEHKDCGNSREIST